MKVPCCSVCHMRYNEEERIPLLLNCGHGFCKSCLLRMFSSSPDTNLSCPRCRHRTVVGNSVHALTKNFPILSLLSSSPNSPSFECDFTDGEDASVAAPNEDEDNGGESFGWCNCSSPIDLGSHGDLRLVSRLGEGRAGHETWSGVIYGSGASGGGRCRRRVAVKRVVVTDEMDVVWVQSRLDSLRRASMWCRNVCTFHGAIRSEGCLSLIMDRYDGSVLDEMQQNKGRLTLEQILRFFVLC